MASHRERYSSPYEYESRYRRDDDEFTYVTKTTANSSHYYQYNPTRLLPNRNHEEESYNHPFHSRSRSSTPNQNIRDTSRGRDYGHSYATTRAASSTVSRADFVDLTDYNTGFVLDDGGDVECESFEEEKKEDDVGSFLLEDQRYRYIHPVLQSKQEKMIHVIDDEDEDEEHLEERSGEEVDTHSQDGIFESDDRLSRMRRESDLVDLSNVEEEETSMMEVHGSTGYHCIDLTQVPSILDDQSVSSTDRDWELRQNQLRKVHSKANNEHWEVQSLPQTHGHWYSSEETLAMANFSPMSLPAGPRPNTYTELPAVTNSTTTIQGLTQNTAIDLVMPVLSQEQQASAFIPISAHDADPPSSPGGQSSVAYKKAKSLIQELKSTTNREQQDPNPIVITNSDSEEMTNDPPGPLECKPSLLGLKGGEPTPPPVILDPPGQRQKPKGKGKEEASRAAEDETTKADAPATSDLESIARQKDCPALILRQLSSPVAPSSPSLELQVKRTAPGLDMALPIQLEQNKQAHDIAKCFQPPTLSFHTRDIHEIIVIDSRLMASASSSSSSNGRESRDPTEKHSNLTSNKHRPESPPPTKRTVRATNSNNSNEPIRTWIPSQANIDSVMRGVPSSTSIGTREEQDDEEQSTADSLLSHLLEDSVHSQSIPASKTVSERILEEKKTSQKDPSPVQLEDDAEEKEDTLEQEVEEHEDDESSTNSSSSFGEEEVEDPVDINKKDTPEGIFGPERQTSFDFDRQDTLSSGEIYCDDDDDDDVGDEPTEEEEEHEDPTVDENEEPTEEEDEHEDPTVEEEDDDEASKSLQLQRSITNEAEEEEGYHSEHAKDILDVTTSASDASELDAEATYASLCFSISASVEQPEDESEPEPDLESEPEPEPDATPELRPEPDFEAAAETTVKRTEPSSKEALTPEAICDEEIVSSCKEKQGEAQQSPKDGPIVNEEFEDDPSETEDDAEAGEEEGLLQEQPSMNEEEQEEERSQATREGIVDAERAQTPTQDKKRVWFKEDIEEVNIIHPFPEPCPVENTVAAVADVWSSKMAGIADPVSVPVAPTPVPADDQIAGEKHSHPEASDKKKKKKKKKKKEKAQSVNASLAEKSVNAFADVWSTKMAGIADVRSEPSQDKEEHNEDGKSQPISKDSDKAVKQAALPSLQNTAASPKSEFAEDKKVEEESPLKSAAECCHLEDDDESEVDAFIGDMQEIGVTTKAADPQDAAEASGENDKTLRTTSEEDDVTQDKGDMPQPDDQLQDEKETESKSETLDDEEGISEKKPIISFSKPAETFNAFADFWDIKVAKMSNSKPSEAAKTKEDKDPKQKETTVGEEVVPLATGDCLEKESPETTPKSEEHKIEKTYSKESTQSSDGEEDLILSVIDDLTESRIFTQETEQIEREHEKVLSQMSRLGNYLKNSGASVSKETPTTEEDPKEDTKEEDPLETSTRSWNNFGPSFTTFISDLKQNALSNLQGEAPKCKENTVGIVESDMLEPLSFHDGSSGSNCFPSRCSPIPSQRETSQTEDSSANDGPLEEDEEEVSEMGSEDQFLGDVAATSEVGAEPSEEPACIAHESMLAAKHLMSSESFSFHDNGTASAVTTDAGDSKEANEVKATDACAAESTDAVDRADTEANAVPAACASNNSNEDAKNVDTCEELVQEEEENKISTDILESVSFTDKASMASLAKETETVPTIDEKKEAKTVIREFSSCEMPEVAEVNADAAHEAREGAPETKETNKVSEAELTGSVINLSFDGSKESSISTLQENNDSPGATLDMECLQVLVTSLMTHEYGFEFSTPLDLSRFPDYDATTSKYKPQDLGSVLRNLINGDYSTILDFQSDVNMTFTFRMKHSKKGSKVYKMAKSLKKKFEKDLLKLLDDLENELIA